MEKTIRNILRKIDIKKITIETETIKGGCIAMPAFIIEVNHCGKKITSKSLDIADAFDDLLSKL
jgi:hypothetical protein